MLCGMPIHIRRHRRHSLCCKCWPDVWQPCQLEHLSQLQFATIDVLHICAVSGVDATTEHSICCLRAHSVPRVKFQQRKPSESGGQRCAQSRGRGWWTRSYSSPIG